MAYGFTSQTDAGSTGSSTTISLSSYTIASGDRLHAYLTYGSGTSVSESMSDGTNTWTKVGSTINDGGNGQSACHFECLNAAAGTYTVTATLASSQAFRGLCVSRYTSLSTSIAGQANQALVNSPGSGANAIGPGNITPAAQPGMLRGVVMDSSGAGETSITAGTGYTTRGAMSNIESAFGVKTGTEDKAISSTSAVAATFTAGSGSGNFLAVGYYAEEGGGGGGGSTDGFHRIPESMAFKPLTGVY